MTMQITCNNGRHYLGALALTLMSFTANAAGLLRVEQTVFGMDCAPCAHATEQALKRLPGAQDVTVSLNHGQAVLKFAPDSMATLAQIREAIRNHGFTPKTAVVSVAGTLEADGDDLMLSAGAAGSYLLGPMDDGAELQALRELPEGSMVQVTGEVPEAPGASARLSVAAGQLLP